MTANRPRYLFAVREPMVELCGQLADRYVKPVLTGEYVWAMTTDPHPGQAMTSITRNDYGKSVPYQTEMWLTFYPTGTGGRAANPQFFVRLSADGLRYGFLLGKKARTAGHRFRSAVQQDAGRIVEALRATGADDLCSFATDDRLEVHVPVRSVEELREWAGNRVLCAGRMRSPDDAMLRADELVGDILLTFDRLLPLFAAAVEENPWPIIARRAGDSRETKRYDSTAFIRDTYTSEAWLDRALGLLRLRRQLLLTGPPGTGKTFLARNLARVLTGGNADNVRNVQFHAGYTYADFVEGTAGDGVLAALAATAATRPAETFVLVIDELTRGHLPTVFGEAFSLLDYRDQAATLPLSRREFRLPPNLYLIATCGPSAPDQPDPGPAVRRRFAVVELSPDAAVLSRWFADHPPADPDTTFGPRVVRLFERLNARLARDLGPDRVVGHSHFMVPDLDAAKLRWVWDHHVRPAVGDRDYPLDRLIADEPAAVTG